LAPIGPTLPRTPLSGFLQPKEKNRPNNLYNIT
jgi:hypothetical protein